MTDNLDIRRKRLLWRASHRGIREMDLVLGGFAKSRIAALDARALAELDAIIATPDQDLLDWITGQAPIPAHRRSATLDELIAFRP